MSTKMLINARPLYGFRRLKVSDVSFLAKCMRDMRSSVPTDQPALVHSLKEHWDVWQSPFTKSWIMEVDNRPVCCISLTRDLPVLEPVGMPEEGPVTFDVPPVDAYSGIGTCTEIKNGIALLAAPFIYRDPLQLMRAWQAAVRYVFQQEACPGLAVILPVDSLEEAEGLGRLGFRKTGASREGRHDYVVYTCRWEEFLFNVG